MENLGEVLQTALEMERQGRECYEQGAAHAVDPVVRAVLQALAGDEADHERLINQLYRAFERHEAAPDVEVAPPVAGDERGRQLAEATAGRVGPDATFVQVYETARDLESRGLAYYREQAAQTTHDHATRFLRALAAVEQTHLQLLEFLLDATRDAAQHSA